MPNPFEKKKATVYTEPFAFALLITIFIVKYFKIHEAVGIAFLIAIGLAIIIALYLLAMHFMLKNEIFRLFFMVFSAFMWGFIVFTIGKIVRHEADGLTCFLAIATFIGTLLAYIHLNFKRLI